MSEAPDPVLSPGSAHAAYPRPQLVRECWLSLDGPWQFAYDDAGQLDHPEQVIFDRQIKVPYPPESAASGVGDPGPHPHLWYRRVLDLPTEWRPGAGERLLLHFGAVDYHARVWVNGDFVTEHHGGHTPFQIDITRQAAQGRLDIAVHAHDDPRDMGQPRGKQDWRDEPHVMFHWRTSGIWQTVWLEVVPQLYVAALRWTPDLTTWSLGLDVTLHGPLPSDAQLRLQISRDGTLLAEQRTRLLSRMTHHQVPLADPGFDLERDEWLWSPESPQLLDAQLELWAGGERLDSVQSYTALRSVGFDGQHVLLNNRPYPLRLVLDQGYWPDSLLSGNDDRLRRDVELTKQLGFNGARQHQKVADPRYLYWCDVLGLLVWDEMPSHYAFTPGAVTHLIREWQEIVSRDASHPSVICWVPFNESWGVPDLPTSAAQRDYVRTLYHLTRTLDPARPVVGNDGWEAVATDVVGVHDYDLGGAGLLARYGSVDSTRQTLRHARPGGKHLALDGFDPAGRPVILSEFGGIDDWDSVVSPGGRQAQDSAHLLRWYGELMSVIHACQGLAGFCYTQLTDTFYERNGLLTAEREPKAPLEQLRRATRGPQASGLDEMGHSARWRERLSARADRLGPHTPGAAASPVLPSPPLPPSVPSVHLTLQEES